MKNIGMAAYIQTIETEVPNFSTDQDKIADFMVRHFQLNRRDEKKLKILYRASGILKRHSVLEDFGKNLNGQGFFKKEDSPTSKSRMVLFQEKAVELGAPAAIRALRSSGIEAKEITHLIAVSCTGMYAPGLDIDLIQKLGLRTDTQRISINFMGCYAAFNAMRLAESIVSADSKSNVLIVCVELCSIHLQSLKDEESLLSNAIFADGAAAMIINAKVGIRSLELKNFYSDLALSAKKEMGWFIGDFGFEMKLSTNVPNAIKKDISQLTTTLLKRVKLNVDDIDYFAIHPGGKKILDVIEAELAIDKEKTVDSRSVLHSYGNMSSPTVLFVIKKIFDQLTKEDHQKHLLSFAFGPGLTLESAVLKAHIHA